MAVYRIERDIGDFTDDEIDAAGFRAVTCLAHFPTLTWIRSFYDPATKHVTCIYEADDPDLIRRHAADARIPCDSVTEVIEYLPEMYR